MRIIALNNKVKIEYASLSDKSIYQKQGSVSYPVTEIQAPLSVVKTVIFDPDTNIENSVSYTYKGAKVHLQGKGFLGFGEITAENTTLDRKITSSYRCDNAYYHPYMEKQEITTAGGQAISTTSYTYDYKKPSGSTSSDKRFFPYMKEQNVKDGLTGLSSRTEIIVIDGDGNPGTIRTFNGNLTETQTVNYVQKGSWCPNKVENMQVVSSYSGNTHTRKTAYEYDDNGNLTKEITDPGDDNQMTTEYKSFDPSGHPQSIVVTAKDGTSRTTGQIYQTPSNRFAGTKTNVLGETTSYDWDEAKGVLKSVTDHRNRTTRYGYNNWGALTSTSYPDGIKTTSMLQWADSAPGKPDDALYYSYTETFGQSPVWTWYDVKGREIRKDYFGLNGKKIHVDTEYNTKGQLYGTSKPYFSGTEKMSEATYDYDGYGRIAKVTTLLGETAYEYSLLETTVTSPAGKKKTTLNNSGFVESEEVNDKKVEFEYYASGLIKSVTPQDGQAISMKYDLQGNRTELNDPDAGVITSKYNGWGELEWTKQKIHLDQGLTTTEYDYRPSGLPNYTKRGDEITNYSYDNLNRLQEISIAGQHKQAFTYDNYDRITNVREELDGKIFDAKTEYDSYGRVVKETYPSGYYTVNQYDDYGYLAKVTDRSDRPVWEAMEANEYGQLTRIKNGQKETSFNFDDKGFLTSISTPGIMDWSYGYDEKGNMISRKDAIANHTEFMNYDDMNRLTAWDIYQGTAKAKEYSMSYDPVTGNIEKKSSLDNLTMNYGENGKPHALTSISDTPTNFSANDLEITYTDFKKIKTLSESNENGDITKFYELMYGVDKQRRKSVYTEDNTTLTRYYLGDYEVEEDSNGNIRKIHYLRGGGILMQENEQESLLYAYTDHLGSLTVLTDEAGAPIERYAFDPWGNRRDPANWTQSDNGPTWKLNRGFTGHEHIDQFGIINMNGRVYDPITSQFFSPDPYVQAPGNWMNYNRYAYCMNNPLIYTDPDGEFWFLAAIVGFAVNYTMTGAMTENWGWKAVGAGAIGAASSMFGYGVGMSAAGALSNASFLSSSAVGIISAGIGGSASGAANALITGGSIGQGALTGLGSGLVGGAISNLNITNFWVQGAVNIGAGGLTGGAISGLTDGNFWDGFKYGAISSAVGWGVNRGSQYLQNKYQRAQYQKLAEEMLKVDSEVKNKELKTWTDRTNIYEVEDPNGVMQSQLKEYYYSLIGNDKNMDISTRFDLLGDGIKFNELHIRFQNNKILYHYDYTDIVRTPLKHILLDTVWQFRYLNF